MTFRRFTKGPLIGDCNICGEHGKLTEDHTPPKGCHQPRAVEIHPIHERLSLGKPYKVGFVSQNGVKYRTLCHRCNNGILGSECDPDFIALVNGIGDRLRSGIILPRYRSPFVTVRPQRVMRAVLGHLSAQGINRYRKGSITDPLKEYMLDISLPLPEEIRIFYWVFPYKDYVMARDCAISDLRVHSPIVCWFIKFFPVGFLVTFDQPSGYSFPANELSVFRGVDKDAYIDLPVSLKNIPPKMWPEAPDDHSMIMYGPEAITSLQRRNIKKYPY